MSVTFTPSPSLPPPSNSVGWQAWIRKNLFSSITNSILTVAVGYLFLSTIINIVYWAIIDADFTGSSRLACESSDGIAHAGACWVIIKVKSHQFMFGLYPGSEYWRIILSLVIFIAGLSTLFAKNFAYKKQAIIFLLVVYPIITFYLLRGGILGLELIETSKWGGLSLTLIISAVGMTISLPLGIILALGRRSKMPIAKSLSVIFIEFIRGVPLISVLFMASVIIPLFLPEGLSFDKLLRALIGIALFQSAYMAEVVRSGLQGINQGQYEAADAMGLNFAKGMYLIIMPQALKLVIPGIVNTFITLFKDTSLVLIIGLFELLGMAGMAIKDPDWLGYATESYVFAAFVFWIFCFSMSKYSQAIERKLNTGH